MIWVIPADRDQHPLRCVETRCFICRKLIPRLDGSTVHFQDTGALIEIWSTVHRQAEQQDRDLDLFPGQNSSFLLPHFFPFWGRRFIFESFSAQCKYYNDRRVKWVNSTNGKMVDR